MWALGAHETLKYLPEPDRQTFLNQVYPILCDTIEQDRRLVYDPQDGLYCGEQSFLDWREQTYPGWTKENVLPIAMSKALSVNVADYFLLKTAADYSKVLGRTSVASRYAKWAEELKASINKRFFDPDAGLYSTYLLSDGVNNIRVHRFDLLGESLAILVGVADQFKAKSILKNYPVGPHGPSVVWPQERTVPIYHNQCIWPFVTAYWIKAARQANNSEAVEQGIRSLEHLAAFNLSNMENYDFVTGQSEVKGDGLDGPVINSRRQLWSVAGYLSMVQDVVFGLETSWEGIRFQPFITAQLRNEAFASSELIELRNFGYRNTKIRCAFIFHRKRSAKAFARSSRIELNGKVVGDGFVPASHAAKVQSLGHLSDSSEVTGKIQTNCVWWTCRTNGRCSGRCNRFGTSRSRAASRWQMGKLVLHYQHGDVANVAFNIYRDGVLYAKAIHATNWLDAKSADYLEHLHSYAVEAVDAVSGNASHLTPAPAISWPKASNKPFQPGRWKIAGEIWWPATISRIGAARTTSFPSRISPSSRSGRYLIRAEFSNGAGPVNTGITCGVKKLEVRPAGSGKVIADGYLVMPQSGDWKRWDLSSPVVADLVAGASYAISIREDDVSRNMSYLKMNEHYTAWPGGGEASCNFVNISALHLILAASPVK